jgi:signal transduction histidine kinase
MEEREVDIDLVLSNEEERRVQHHSFVNVLNVIHSELQLMERILDARGSFADLIKTSESIVRSFSDPGRVKEQAAVLEEFTKKLRAALAERPVSHVAGDPAKEAEVEEVVNVINEVIDVAEVRVHELLARSEAVGRFESIPIEELRGALVQVFTAISSGSRGRYGVSFERETAAPTDYVVNLDIVSNHDPEIHMPSVFHDVIRDLIANARKYSEPGSTITCRIEQTPEVLSLRIEDEGRGIPDQEIEDVVRFGIRGSNVGDNETRGGGFGLTKAYYVTKQYGGRMFIASELARGTSIRIELPAEGTRDITAAGL